MAPVLRRSARLSEKNVSAPPLEQLTRPSRKKAPPKESARSSKVKTLKQTAKPASKKAPKQIPDPAPKKGRRTKLPAQPQQIQEVHITQAHPLIENPPLRQKNVRRKPPEEPAQQVEDMEVSETEEEQLDGGANTTAKIKSLFGGTCKLYHVGPLFDFEDVSDRTLRMNSKKIVTALQENLPQKGDKIYAVEFSQLTDIHKSAHEHSSIFIEIHRVDKGSNRSTLNVRGRKPKIVFLGLFTSSNSVKPVTRFLNDEHEQAVHIPLFICNTTDKIWKVVQEQLKKIYTCNFIAHRFTWSNMTFITGKWIMRTGIHDGDQIKFNFIPIVNRGCESDWECLIDLNTWRKDWKKLMTKPQNNGESDEDLHILWNDIMNYICKLNGMKLNSVNLMKICFRSLVITSAGKIKIQGIEDLNAVEVVLMNLTRTFEFYETNHTMRRLRPRR